METILKTIGEENNYLLKDLVSLDNKGVFLVIGADLFEGIVSLIPLKKYLNYISKVDRFKGKGVFRGKYIRPSRVKVGRCKNLYR